MQRRKTLVRPAGIIVALLILIAATGWSSPAARAATTFCVLPGSSTCRHTISGALHVAVSGDTINVAAGTYVENVSISTSVKLLGGWNATFTRRRPKVTPSTIVAPTGSINSVVTIQGVYGHPNRVAPTVGGFIIKGGNPGNHGGGMRIVDSNATVSGNIVKGNIAYLLGGGIWIQRGSPHLVNNQVINNEVTGGGEGGGIELEDSTAVLHHNTVSGNVIDGSTGEGGGIAVEGGGPVVFSQNTVSGNAPANQADTTTTDVANGGGVAVRDADFSMTGDTIKGNSANNLTPDFGMVPKGRGTGGGLFVTGSPSFTMTGVTVTGNTAGESYYDYLVGGGIMVASSSGSLLDVTITSNQANRNILFGDGGGLALQSSSLSIKGGAITGNITAVNHEGYGGGIYAKDSTLTLDATVLTGNAAGNTPAYGLGGAMAFVNSWYVLTNAIVANNIAFPNDTAVGGVSADASSPGTIVNSTFVSNKGQAIRTASTLLTLNTIVTGATTGIDASSGALKARFDIFYGNGADVKGATLDSTDLLVDPMLNLAFHLTAASPAIDAGTSTLAPNHDIDGDPRPLVGTSGHARFDVGADEY